MDAILKLYVGVTEYGTSGNPVSFVGAIAGNVTLHPLNPFYLWNDKGGIVGSVPAKQISIQVLEMWIEDELMGVSTGGSGQTFTALVLPIRDDSDPTEILVTVGTTVWTRVGSFTGVAVDAEVYTIDPITGIVTFGDGVNGKIPPLGSNIYITYMPDLITYGKEIFENTWLEVKSLGVTTNSVTVVDEQLLSLTTTQVQVANVTVTGVSGVWLATDPGHTGTNYYTGGSFDPPSGNLIFGTPVPLAHTAILVNYTYVVVDDNESSYSPIGLDTLHTFTNPIPKNNAKLLYFRLNVPPTASTGGGGNLNFRIQLTYRQ